MINKEDWESSAKRFDAFWHHEVADRCCIHITAPQEKRIPLPPLELDEAYRTDPEAIIYRSRIVMQNTYYAGDAFPCLPVDLGASGHAGFFKGAKYLIRDTVWFFPSLEDPDALEFDENSYLYKKTIELAKAFAEDSKGDYFVAMPDCTGNADALAHLMGSEALLEAMIDAPETVERALKKIQYAYERAMNTVRDITKDVNRGGGCVGWLNTWAPGFHAQMQCDMSVMISKPMFDRFIAPELRAQSAMLDYALYHFDGIEQRRHLDTLLSIPELKTIQWTQVVGQPPCTDFMDDLRRIQTAGKNLLISVTPDQVEPLMTQLSSKGLYLLTSVSSRYEADELLKKAIKWTHD